MADNPIIRRFNQLKSARFQWEAHWQDLADYILPRRGSITAGNVPGEKRAQKVQDSTAIVANDMLAAAMIANLANPTTAWFALRAVDDGLNEAPGVAKWLEDARDRMLARFSSPRAGFTQALHEIFLDLGCFGTAAMFVAEDDGIMFSARALSEIYVAENAHGQIDTVFRRFKETARNIEALWPGRAGGEVAKAAEKEPDKQFEIVHAVFPRKDRDPRVKLATAMPWASVYVLVEGEKVLSEGGFHEMPYMVPRWSKMPGEVYGRSPGMLALPDVKQLNAVVRTTLRAAQKATDPPLVASDDGVIKPVRTAPGAIIYGQFFPNGALPIQPLPQPTNFNLPFDLIARLQANIAKAFLVDQLNLPERDPRMTLGEFLERNEQRLLLQAPQLARLQGELFGPLIDRVFAIMLRRGEFPPPPEALAGADLKIEYVSPAARAQRSQQAGALQRWLMGVSPLAQFDPSVMDNLDMDKAARGGADILGVPADWLRSADDVAAIREARAEAARQQQAAQEALAVTEGARNVAPLVRAANAA